MEADLEVIALPGWDAVPRGRSWDRTLKAMVALAALVVATLAGDAYAIYRGTSVQAAEQLGAVLAEARALEKLRNDADLELRLKALFPDDQRAYGDAVQALGREHAARLNTLAKRARGIVALDGAVRKGRAALVEALQGQEKSIRAEVDRHGTLYDTLADAFPEAGEAVAAARRRWGVSGSSAAAPKPFASIEPTLREWRKPLDVPSGLRIVVSNDDVVEIDLDTGAERVLSGQAAAGHVIGHWLQIFGDTDSTLLDMRTGVETSLGERYLVPTPGGVTGWLSDFDGESAVEVTLPDAPTGKEFRGVLAGDTGTMLVAYEGFSESLAEVALYDRATHRLVRRLGSVEPMRIGKDALAWRGGDGELHLLTGRAERVIDFPDDHYASDVAFTPDGKTAAVSTSRDPGTATLWLVPEGATTAQEVWTQSPSSFYDLHWSPRGDWLVFMQGRRSQALSMADRSVHRIRVRTEGFGVLGVAP